LLDAGALLAQGPRSDGIGKTALCRPNNNVRVYSNPLHVDEVRRRSGYLRFTCRAQFEIMGPAGLRADMITGNYIKNVDTLNQAQEWLKEQDSIKERREILRFWSMILLTARAAIAASIAAWPVLKG
jgi:hypothetical protein